MQLIQRFEKNTRGRDFVVGDIHGRFTALLSQLINIRFNFDFDRLFCTGDLVDGNFESVLAARWLGFAWFFSVMGNHDERVANAATANLSNWFNKCGGEWFAALKPDEQLHFTEVFQLLPTVIEVETDSGLVGIIHADCPVDDWNNLSDVLDNHHINHQDRRNAINCCRWSRRSFKSGDSRYIDNIRTVYFGHNRVKVPEYRCNSVYLDTGNNNSSSLFTILQIN